MEEGIEVDGGENESCPDTGFIFEALNKSIFRCGKK